MKELNRNELLKVLGGDDPVTPEDPSDDTDRANSHNGFPCWGVN